MPPWDAKAHEGLLVSMTEIDLVDIATDQRENLVRALNRKGHDFSWEAPRSSGLLTSQWHPNKPLTPPWQPTRHLLISTDVTTMLSAYGSLLALKAWEVFNLPGEF
ncbi:hypothetical protein F4778DRAFT_779497 [Xylariomycetidae sp. FL2044]|nr:hypothetical protein F4778DRAFT_779497 [Xylariomycetidae sp. FL2044]